MNAGRRAVRRWGWVSALAAVLLCGATARASQSDEQAVREVFASYQRALLSGDGAAAAALVDADTAAYWQQLRSLAARGAEEEIAGRSFLERLLVTAVRRRFTASEIPGLELAEVMKVAVDAGWIAGSSIAQLAMGEVSIEGDLARGVVVQSGGLAALMPADGAPALHFEFVREQQRWRFRFASLLHGLERLLGELLRQLGASEDEVLFAIIESLSDRPLVPDAAQPPPGTR